MLHIIFKNDLGEIKFSGDGNSPFSLTAITGLGLPEKIYQTREYLDFDGQQTISSRFSPRTITIAFDLKGKEVSSLTAKLYKTLTKDGVLYVISDTSSRRINVHQITVDSFSQRGPFRSFTAQFICDNPYFWDTATVTKPCYALVGGICYDTENAKWNLDTPAIWGKTDNDTIFNNTGDVKAQPLLTIYSNGDAADSAGFEILRVNPIKPDEILQKFALNYALSDGEKITICFDPCSDKKRRYIISSKGTNLLNYKTKTSSLSDFYFDCGENRIIINNLSQGNLLSAHIFYENQYVEGVF